MRMSHRSIRCMFAVSASIAVATFLVAAPSASAPSDRVVETLTGAEARAYLEKYWHSTPKRLKAHKESVAALRAKGHKPTEFAAVFRIKSTRPRSYFTRLMSSVVPTLYAQTYSDSSGEVWFSSWDDGNDLTWEGEAGGATTV